MMSDCRELWACDKCPKRFYRRGQYNQHLKTHTKPIKCDLCGNGFALRTDLKRHVQSQHRLGNKRHTCGKCGQDFARKDTLLRHFRKRHFRESEERTSNDQVFDPQPTAVIDIWHAASVANIDLIRNFCANGGNVSSKAEDGSTMLHCAARAGHLNVIEFLLEQGADACIRNKRGKTAFNEAITGGSLAAIIILFPSAEMLQEHWPLSRNEHFFLERTLYDAAAKGAGSDLIKSIVNTAAKSLSHMWSEIALKEIAPDLLHHAAVNGRVTLVHSLLSEEDFEVDHKIYFWYDITVRGATPIYFAALQGHTDVVAALLLYDQTLGKLASHRGPALEAAARKGKTEIFKMLLSYKGIEINYLGSKGRSPLHSALQNGHIEICKILLDQENIDLSPTKNRRIRSLLHSATISGCPEIVQLILDNTDIDINATAFRGETVLHEAVRRGHSLVVKLLLTQPGIHADCRTLHNESPLHFAAERGHIEVVKLLLLCENVGLESRTNGRARPSWRGDKTALDFAKFKGYQEIVDLLIENGATDHQGIHPNHTPRPVKNSEEQERGINVDTRDENCCNKEMELDTQTDQAHSDSDEDMNWTNDLDEYERRNDPGMFE